MAGRHLWSTPVLSEWIDFNGHMRDAYYGLVVSLATDVLMDEIGMDAAYRERSRCTLYTLEMHLHFLDEVKLGDTLVVALRVLAHDAKRLHVALEMRCARHAGPVATAEFMLLHVQQGEKPGAAPFPPAIAARIAALAAATAALPADGPGSRQMQLKARP